MTSDADHRIITIYQSENAASSRNLKLPPSSVTEHLQDDAIISLELQPFVVIFYRTQMR